MGFEPILKRFKVWDKAERRFIARSDLYPNVNSGESPDGTILDLQDIALYFCTHATTGFVFLQSTGLSDRNGVKIFEGDIVSFKNHNYLVKNENGCYFIDNPKLGVLESCWTFDSVSLRRNCIEDCLGLVEVIGNIFQNPELLEEQ